MKEKKKTENRKAVPSSIFEKCAIIKALQMLLIST
jgi:hypothetical protein